jgi:hypothetical protein
MRTHGFYKCIYRGNPAVGYCHLAGDDGGDYEWWTLVVEISPIPNKPPHTASVSLAVQEKKYPDYSGLEVIEPLAPWPPRPSTEPSP